MNQCILMAEIVQPPELRYTSDTQTPIAEMVVQFPGLRPEEPTATLKVVGWGNLAQEIQENYRQGDWVVIEGRLSMNTLDRPEGFKEKRAELVAQRIHSLNGASMGSVSAAAAPLVSEPPAKAEPVAAKARSRSSTKAPAVKAPAVEENYDDIPF